VGQAISGSRGTLRVLRARPRPAEDLDSNAVRVEDEQRVIALDIAVFRGREVNLVAACQAAFMGGIDLSAASR
jgi:c-di-GMP-binding flagellar brake protein YcgR